MSLRLQAAADFALIATDVDGGFAWPMTVTDPAGLSAVINGITNDIAQTIDPQTGQAVAGRIATATLPIAALTAAGMSIPKNIPDRTSKPWIIRFNDISGAPHAFKVSEALPDLTLGLVVCWLEAYKPTGN